MSDSFTYNTLLKYTSFYSLAAQQQQSRRSPITSTGLPTLPIPTSTQSQEPNDDFFVESTKVEELDESTPTVNPESPVETRPDEQTTMTHTTDDAKEEMVKQESEAMVEE